MLFGVDHSPSATAARPLRVRFVRGRTDPRNSRDVFRLSTNIHDSKFPTSNARNRGGIRHDRAAPRLPLRRCRGGARAGARPARPELAGSRSCA
ncbi:hypothetical protein ACFPRL_19980 [Pseudoclavibacter helvolus]